MRISRVGPRGPWTAHDAHVLARQQLLASARRVARTGVLLTPTACTAREDAKEAHHQNYQVC
jgi:hypothetical protein